MEDGCHDRHQSIGSPEGSLEGGEAISHEPIQLSSFSSFSPKAGGDKAILFSLVNLKELDPLEEEPQRKDEKSNPDQRPLNKSYIISPFHFR